MDKQSNNSPQSDRLILFSVTVRHEVKGTLKLKLDLLEYGIDHRDLSLQSIPSFFPIFYSVTQKHISDFWSLL